MSKKDDDELATTRLHVMPGEVKKLRDAAKKGRNGHRNETMIYMAYRHGLRVHELVRFKWDQVLWEEEDVYIQRCKGSESGTHPMDDWEMKALRALARAAKAEKGWVFRSERGDKMSENGFYKMLSRAGKAAGLAFDVHPHMLRHGTGFRMNAERCNTRTIQGWLGHKNIANTERYTAMGSSHYREAGLGREKGRRS
jgi:type 1 fimbriae regulatory protein FimB/type 1 fimbriae regulatory protein FimE